MIEEDVAFVVISLLTIGAAIVALESKQIVYGAIALGFSFLGIAGLFIVLDATFVALFQIIVYIGAVAVLILFTVMLVGESKFFKETPTRAGKVVGIITAILLALTLVLSFGASSMSKSGAQATAPSYADIGNLLTGQYAPVLELLGLLIASSLVGALTLAKVEKKQES
jgi:NADH-quinone oxidoreductase subunit J